MFATQLVVAVILSYFIAKETIFLLSHHLSQFTATFILLILPITFSLHPHSNPFGVDQNSYMRIASFMYPTECTTRFFLKNVKTYIKMPPTYFGLTKPKTYIKMPLHISV